MQSYWYRLAEFFIIFIIVPISFVFDYPLLLKLSIGIVSFAYILFILLKVEDVNFKINPEINWKHFWKRTLLKFFLIAILTTYFVWFTAQDSLFDIVLSKPLLWIGVLFIYSVFSVYPQELVYRTFFFQRYNDFFFNIGGLLMLNAMAFSLAHLLFKSPLVILISFLGGLLFAFTYHNSKSTLLVSIEHAIYGCWLFTVGMGEMLGFPT